MNADQFNALYPIGTPVVAYPGCRPEDDSNDERLVTRTRSKAEVLGGHTDVVWVDGHSSCIALTHVDVTPRTNTPDVITYGNDGQSVTRTIKVKRACNGCGQHLGDIDNRDVDEHGNLTDVRAECTHCAPLVELEAAGCRTWQLTPRSHARIDHEIDRLGEFAKAYTQCVDGRITSVGIRIGVRPVYVVARYGDWIVRHPDGRWSVHKAPATAGTEATA